MPFVSRGPQIIESATAAVPAEATAAATHERFATFMLGFGSEQALDLETARVCLETLDRLSEHARILWGGDVWALEEQLNAGVASLDHWNAFEVALQQATSASSLQLGCD